MSVLLTGCGEPFGKSGMRMSSTQSLAAESHRACCNLQECLVLFKGPSDVAVEEVHAILRHIVARTLESEECKGLAQYGQLKREIATCAAAALESMKDDARKMVLTMVSVLADWMSAPEI